jgi:replicative DNA helicase
VGAKLAGATCRLAALLHLAAHLRDGWARPIASDTFAGAARLADYLIDHARAVFDLMGADPRVDDARWLLDWISRTNQAQFSRRDAHQAAHGRFRKATDLEPALALLEEHGWLRRVDADPAGPKGGRPPSPRFLVNPLPHNSVAWSPVTLGMRENRAGRPPTSGVLGAGEGRNSV